MKLISILDKPLQKTVFPMLVLFASFRPEEERCQSSQRRRFTRSIIGIFSISVNAYSELARSCLGKPIFLHQHQ